MPPETVENLSRAYPVWLSDVWGVVHDGHKPIVSAVLALERHRANGGTVIFITNAPRPKATIMAHLDEIGVPRAAADDLVSSGDVTRDLMVHHGQGGLFHIGPETDVSLFDGLGVERVTLDKADAVACTGFYDVSRETPQDYLPLLQDMHRRHLTMICANPDKVVRIGKHLVRCAGSIAEVYEQMGGHVLMAGKPFAPIYDLALQKAGNPPRKSVMVIGDGPETDIAGAAAQNLPCLFVTGGINASHGAALEVHKKYPTARILAAMPELEWR